MNPFLRLILNVVGLGATQSIDAIARILRYGAPDSSSSDEGGSSEVESGGEEVDVDIDDTTDIDI